MNPHLIDTKSIYKNKINFRPFPNCLCFPLSPIPSKSLRKRNGIFWGFKFYLQNYKLFFQQIRVIHFQRKKVFPNLDRKKHFAVMTVAKTGLGLKIKFQKFSWDYPWILNNPIIKTIYFLQVMPANTVIQNRRVKYLDKSVTLIIERKPLKNYS